MFDFIFRPKSPNEQFWKWFVKHEDELFHANAADGSFQNKINKHLKAVNRGLTWEFSPHSAAPRHFVISADGIRDVFDAVEALADAAPLEKLARWKIIRFRPRCHDLDNFVLEMNGKEVATKDVEVSLCPQGIKVGIEMFFRGCRAKRDSTFGHITFILLDTALGEYDVTCKVGTVEALPFEHAASGSPRIPFTQLRIAFDAMIEESCRSGPSQGK